MFTIGLESDPAIRYLFPEFEGFGRLIQSHRGGQWSFMADISAYERQFNPDGCLENGAHPYVTQDVMLAVVRDMRNGHLRAAGSSA